MSSGLSTGVPGDEQFQRFCKQVYGPMNNVKRFVHRYTR